jgi:hypothetical protein
MLAKGGREWGVKVGWLDSEQQESIVIGYIFRVELTPFALNACWRLPKRKATCENFILLSFVRYKAI